MTALEGALAPGEVGQVDAVRLAPGAVAQSGRLRRILVALDALASTAGWGMGLLATAGITRPDGTGGAALTAAATGLFAAVTVLAVAAHRLYLARVCAIRTVEIGRIGKAVLVAVAIALTSPRVLSVDVATSGAMAGGVLAFVGLIGVRAGYRGWLQAGRRDGRFLRPVVVVGTNEETFELCKLVGDHPEMGYRVVGIIGDRADHEALGLRSPWLGPVDDSLGAVRRAGANGALLVANALPVRQLNAVSRALLRAGIHVHLSSGVWGIDHRRLRSQPLAYEPLFYLEPLRLSRWQLVVKRVIDLGATVAGGLLVAAPVLLVAAVAIKLSDRGPVLYKQVRVGRHGRPITVYKLRTMVPDADKLYDELAPTRAGRDGPLIKLADDPRRTRVGRVLERCSIDELPQLWNVLKGEMSLVGPRPAQPSEVARFDEELQLRHQVPPGITGLWQVEARDNPSFAAYRRFDLFYIENWSVSLDLAILAATAQRVFSRGAGLLTGRAETREHFDAGFASVPD